MIREVNSGGYVKSFVVSPVPVTLYRVEGDFRTAGSTDFWIQVFDAIALPANGTKPLKSWRAQSQFFFNDHIGEGMVLHTGCVVALSSTENTLTIATVSGDNCDFYTDIEEYETLAVKPTQTITGDLTNNRSILQVWAEAAGPKKLARIQFTETAGAITYVQLFAKDAPNAGVDAPIRQWKVAANATVDLAFGLNGIPVYSQDPDETNHIGCTVALSLTSGAYDGGNGQGTIRAASVVG